MSTRQRSPCIHLFNIRCTLLAFQGLMWSFILESKQEYMVSSLRVFKNDKDALNKHLNAIVITGAVCLGVYAILTLLGFSVQSIGTHYLMNVLHSVGILLVIISILNYWNIKLLWIPTILCCAIPAIYEIIFIILKFVSHR
ncbi:hypothetical protein M9Y10_021619 [Tritrichomonas musculus]|uniref:Transmembrane protein 107 n=1 Tax=Tritrichomonas musculus TaxID=1915356 RepID=A0ABR2KQB6_9EUKA